MHSSISNSDDGHDRYARQTAADRPGVAQPIPQRPVPDRPWSGILLGVVAVWVVLIGSWELGWRLYGAIPGMRNTYGLWAIQRRRIDGAGADATVVLGGSRAYYDIQLPVWERSTGHRPVQLAFEGTSPLPYLENLAADPTFRGLALVSIEPSLMFSGREDHGAGVQYANAESPSQHIGQSLSMNFVEPYFAFDDPDFALETVLARLPWPARPGRTWPREMRKLAIHEADRNTYLWNKVADDASYRELVRDLWRENFNAPAQNPHGTDPLEVERQQISRAAKAVAQLRARGARILFLRLPSSGEYLAYENDKFPRARTWDALLYATGAPGIYFEDYQELQGYYLPDWSHMTRAGAERFTAALYRIVARMDPIADTAPQHRPINPD